MKFAKIYQNVETKQWYVLYCLCYSIGYEDTSWMADDHIGNMAYTPQVDLVESMEACDSELHAMQKMAEFYHAQVEAAKKDKPVSLGDLILHQQGVTAGLAGLGVSDNPYVAGYSAPFEQAFKWEAGRQEGYNTQERTNEDGANIARILEAVADFMEEPSSDGRDMLERLRKTGVQLNAMEIREIMKKLLES